MPRRYVLVRPEDGALYRLAVAVERQGATEPLEFATLARLLTEVEAGEAEVNIAQMSEILSGLRSLLAGDPKAVLEVLAGKVPEA